VNRTQWNRAALGKLRMVHVPTGTAGNLVAHWGKRATLFVRWEHVGTASLPVFEQFPKVELTPEM
jgi:hypothetical protein